MLTLQPLLPLACSSSPGKKGHLLLQFADFRALAMACLSDGGACPRCMALEQPCTRRMRKDGHPARN